VFKHIFKYLCIQISIVIGLLILLSSVKIKNVRIWSFLNRNIISEGGQTKLMFDDLEKFVPKRNTVFVVGSSHAYRGYDPRIFEQSGYTLFNMGTSGQNMKDTYSLVKLYKDKIKTMIIDIYPGVLQDVTEESTLMLIQNAGTKKTAFQILKNNITINSINNTAARLFDVNPKSIPYSEKYVFNGYVETYHDFKSDSTLTYNPFKPGANFLYLDSLLSYATHNDIGFCIASHPLKYNAAYKRYYIDSYLPILNKILKKYPRNKFFDYTLLHCNKDSLFSDANHLSQKGVNWYNAELIKNIKTQLKIH